MLTGGNGEIYIDCRVPNPIFIRLSPRVTTVQLSGIETILQPHITEKVYLDSKISALRVSVSFLGDVQRLKKDLQKYHQAINRIYEFPIPDSTLRGYKPALKEAAERFHQELSNTAEERYSFQKGRHLRYY